jgi:hypothetical protein
MEATADLRLVLSRELETEELSLEHDTVVVSPETSRRVIAALRRMHEEATVIDFPVSVGH